MKTFLPGKKYFRFVGICPDTLYERPSFKRPTSPAIELTAPLKAIGIENDIAELRSFVSGPLASQLIAAGVKNAKKLIKQLTSWPASSPPLSRLLLVGGAGRSGTTW